MYKNIALSASVMCIDWLDAGVQLRNLEELGIDYLHFDVVDGRFAPDFTMGSSIIDVFRENSKLKSDYHLMVEEPSRLFQSYQIRKNDIFTIHQECSRNLHRDIIRLRRLGALVGVAMCPATPLTALEYIIEDLDYVIIMTVNPGFKGQALVQQALRKIEDLKDLIKRMDVDVKISVDGNVNPKTIPDMVAAGADVLVLGSSGLFRKDCTLPGALEHVHFAIDQGIKHR